MVLEYSARSLGASEEDLYEFTRCVRPDGTSYGTGGNCRKGVESALFQPDGGISTQASGGRVGGSQFPKTTKPIRYRDAESEVIQTARDYSKPFNKPKKAKAVLDAAYKLLDAYKTNLDAKGADSTLDLLYNTERWVHLLSRTLEDAKKKKFLNKTKELEEDTNEALWKLASLQESLTVTRSYRAIDVLRRL